MARKKTQLNPLVVQSNFFIRRKKKTDSIYMLRLVASIAKRVRLDDEDFKEYAIPVSEILGENYSGAQLKELKTSTKALLSCIYERQYEDGSWEMSTIIEHPRYNSPAATFTLKFAPQMKKNYLKLNDNFTKYSYEEFMLLTSTYTQRLYEILKSYQPLGTKTVTIENLHEWLDTPEAYRKDFAMFRRKVLEPAHRNIVGNEAITSLWFTWETKRAGRGGKVSEITFVFNPITAERIADADENKKQATTQDAQTRSWACYQEHKQKYIKCVPKPRNPKCKYCLERGAMFVNFMHENIAAFDSNKPLSGQFALDEILKAVTKKTVD